MNIAAPGLRPSVATAGALRSLAVPPRAVADSVHVSHQKDKPGFYEPGQIMVRAATGAIGGAITLAISGGGIGPTAALGAGVYGALGFAVGAAFGAVAGAAVGSPIGGAVSGGLIWGGRGVLRGAVRGAILGGLAGLFGAGPASGAIAGGLLAAAGI